MTQNGLEPNIIPGVEAKGREGKREEKMLEEEREERRGERTERGGTDSFFYKDNDIYLFVRVVPP